METGRRRILAGVAAVLLVAGFGYAYTSTDFLNGSPTGQVVKDYYELSTGNTAEVLTVEDLGSMDRVVLKPSNSRQVSTFYVTDDGEYIVRNPVNVDNSTRKLEARNEFVSCLSTENATFYGVLTSNRTFAQHTRMTQLQLRVLGGSQGLQDVFGGVGQGRIRKAVLQNGIVWSVDGNFTAGIRTIPQLEKMTGCNYTVQD